MITICYPPGAGGMFVLSLMQQDPSVCSCANIGLFWHRSSRMTKLEQRRKWRQIEDANLILNRSCCDRVHFQMTHMTPDQLGQLAWNRQKRSGQSRQSQQQKLTDMKQEWLVITCTESDRAWLIENQRRKPYIITDSHNQVIEQYEPTRYQRYSARVRIPFRSLWTKEGITESIEQISQGFDLTLDPTASIELAEAWWAAQLHVGIEPPCV